MYKAAFQVQKRAPIMVSMTTYCKAYVLDINQWYTAHTDAGAFFHSQMATSKSHKNRWLGWCEQSKIASLSKVETSHYCNDVKIERIPMPGTTVSQQTEQLTTRYSSCNNIDNCVYSDVSYAKRQPMPMEDGMQMKRKLNQIT